MPNNVRIVVNIDNRASTGINALNADLRGLVTQLDNVGNTTNRASASLNSMGGTLGSVERRVISMGVAFLTLQVAKGIFDDIKESVIGFNDTIYKTAAFTNLGLGTTLGYADKLRDFSAQIGISAKDLGESLYFVGSAGLDAAKVLETTEISGKAAAAGLGSAADVGRILVSVQNAYKDTNLTAAQAMDILTVAAKDGNAEINEYAKGIGKVLPLSSTMGISFRELAASLSTMSNVGMDIDVAATAFRGMETAILQSAKSTGMQGKALAELGLSYQDVMAMIHDSSIGFGGTMVELYRRAQLQGETGIATLERLIPNVRALTGFLATAASQQEAYALTLEHTGDAAGAFEKAYEQSTQRASQSLNMLRTSIESIGISTSGHFLEGMSDGIRELAKEIDPAHHKFDELGTAIKAFTDIPHDILINFKINVPGGSGNLGDDIKKFLGFEGKLAGMTASNMPGTYGNSPIMAIPKAELEFLGISGRIRDTLKQEDIGSAIKNAFTDAVGDANISNIGHNLILLFGKGIGAGASGINAETHSIGDIIKSWANAEISHANQYGRSIGEQLLIGMKEGVGGKFSDFGKAVNDKFQQISGNDPGHVEANGSDLKDSKNWLKWETEPDSKQQAAKLKQSTEELQAAIRESGIGLGDSIQKYYDLSKETDFISKEGNKLIDSVGSLFTTSAFSEASDIAARSIGDWAAKVDDGWRKALDPEKYQKFHDILAADMALVTSAYREGELGNPDAEAMMAGAKAKIQQDLASVFNEIEGDKEKKKQQADADAKRRKDEADARRARDIPSLGFANSTSSTEYQDQYKYAGAGAAQALDELSNSDVSHNAALGSKIKSELNKVKEELKKSKIPGWQEAWNELFSAATDAVNTESPAAIARVKELLAGVNEEIRAARGLTVDSFSKALGRTAIEEAVGSSGASILDPLRKGIIDGLDDMATPLAQGVSKLGKELQNIFPNDLAREKYATLSEAIQSALVDGTEEGIDKVNALLSDLNIEQQVYKIAKTHLDSKDRANNQYEKTIESIDSQEALRTARQNASGELKRKEDQELAQYGIGPLGRVAAAQERSEKKFRTDDRESQTLTISRDREDSETKISRAHEDQLQIMQKQNQQLQLQNDLRKMQANITQKYSETIDKGTGLFGGMGGTYNASAAEKVSAAIEKEKEAMNEKVQQQMQANKLQDEERKLQREWQDEAKSRQRQAQDDDRARQRAFQEEDEGRELEKAQNIENLKRTWELNREGMQYIFTLQDIQNQKDAAERTRDLANLDAGKTYNEALDKLRSINEDFISDLTSVLSGDFTPKQLSTLQEDRDNREEYAPDGSLSNRFNPKKSSNNSNDDSSNNYNTNVTFQGPVVGDYKELIDDIGPDLTDVFQNRFS